MTTSGEASGDFLREPNKLGDFYAERLAQVQEDGLTGEWTGESILFSAGVEVEFVLHERLATDGNRISFQSDHYGDLTPNEQTGECWPKNFLRPAEGFNVITPLGTGQKEQLIGEAQADMKAMLQALKPRTTEEAQLQTSYLEQIENVTLSDIVNFRLYQEFATPALSETAPVKGASYRDVCNDNSDEAGWLEFRFGNKTLQSGYYDHEGVSEFRTRPCSPLEAALRTERIIERLTHIAAAHGFAVDAPRFHLNLGGYVQDAEGEYMPTVGNTLDRQAVTMDIVSGIAAAIQDGAHLAPYTSSLNNIQSYGAVKLASDYNPLMGRDLEFGPTRLDLRVLEDRLEWRAGEMSANLRQGFLWLSAGALRGLATGEETLRESAYVTAGIRKWPQIVPTSLYDKVADISPHRILEESIVASEGEVSFDPQRVCSSERTEVFFTRLTGLVFKTDHLEHPERVYRNMARGILDALVVDPDGALTCEAAKLTYLSLTTAVAERVTTVLGSFLVKPAVSIYASFQIPRLTERQIVAALTASDTARIAYGGDEAYAQLVAGALAPVTR